jgi:hypothetical protein
LSWQSHFRIVWALRFNRCANSLVETSSDEMFLMFDIAHFITSMIDMQANKKIMFLTEMKE